MGMRPPCSIGGAAVETRHALEEAFAPEVGKGGELSFYFSVSSTNICSGRMLKEAGSGGLEGMTYSELRGPHLSHGSFLLIAEVTWEISRMSPSVQQLSVIGKDRIIFYPGVSQDIWVDIFVTTSLKHVAFKDKRCSTLTVSIQRALPQVRLGAGRGLVFAILKTRPRRLSSTNQQGA